jgi:hypothetical protein
MSTEGEYSKQTDLDLLISMLNNQGAFVCSKIPLSERALFMATMSEIILKAKTSVDYAHVVKGFQTLSEDMLKPKRFLVRLFHNPTPTKQLAFDVAEDIIDSIRVRFVDGGSKCFPGMMSKEFKDAFVAVSRKKDAKEIA